MYPQHRGYEYDGLPAAERQGPDDNKSATGVVAAGYELGTLYEQGLGVDQDLDKAKELYQEAAQYKNEDAIEALARLAE